jgi:cytochrome c peroxidase
MQTVMSLRATLSCLAATMLVTSALAGDLVTVGQRGLRFSTADLTVAKDQIVIFMNNDTATHNIMVVGEGIRVNGGLQSPGAEFRVPFSKPGTYIVSCGIHPKMKMTVTVK